MPPTAEEWLAHYAAALGVAPLSADELDTILALAGVAAHSSERIAAPAACWLAARADVSLAEARRLADEIG